MDGKNWRMSHRGRTDSAWPSAGSAQCPVGALAHPIGVGVFDEAALEGRLDQLAEGMMHHPIPKGRGRNQAALGLVDGEAVVRPGPIAMLQ